MKKSIACLLTLCLLLLCTAPALAATPITDYTLEEKWDLQMQGSGFKGTVTFGLEGDAAFGAEPMTWEALKTLLPGMTVELSSAPRDEQRETKAVILNNGQEAGHVHVLTDGVQYALESNLINENTVYYAFPANFDFSFLWQKADEKWPSVWPMLFAMTHASQDWQQRAEALATPYMTKLAVWMQSYMDVTAETQESQSVTRMYCEIPAADVKTQMKQMMVDLYRDDALLSLLREVFSAREAAAYLDGSMQDTFFTMLDLLQLDGAVVIDRLYDAQGNALLDSITLPFAQTNPVKTLTIAITPDGEGQALTLSGVMQDDRAFQVVANAQADGVVTGNVKMDVLTKALASSENAEAAENTEAALQIRAFDFHLISEDTEETYDLESDLCARQQEYTLVLNANDLDTTGMHDLSLSVRSEMTSKSSRRAATYIDSSISLTDQTQGSTLTMTVKCNTASPWTPMTIAELSQQPMQLGTMEESTLNTLKNQWQTRFESWLTQLIMGSFAKGMQ